MSFRPKQNAEVNEAILRLAGHPARRAESHFCKTTDESFESAFGGSSIEVEVDYKRASAPTDPCRAVSIGRSTPNRALRKFAGSRDLDFSMKSHHTDDRFAPPALLIPRQTLHLRVGAHSASRRAGNESSHSRPSARISLRKSCKDCISAPSVAIEAAFR